MEEFRVVKWCPTPFRPNAVRPRRVHSVTRGVAVHTPDGLDTSLRSTASTFFLVGVSTQRPAGSHSRLNAHGPIGN